MLVEEQGKEDTKWIDVRQVGHHPTASQAALGPSLLGETATTAKEDETTNEAQIHFECRVQVHTEGRPGPGSCPKMTFIKPKLA